MLECFHITGEILTFSTFSPPFKNVLPFRQDPFLNQIHDHHSACIFFYFYSILSGIASFLYGNPQGDRQAKKVI